jgi:hypothetical protein
MALEKTTLERAFEVALSGRVASMSELEQVLKSEGYDLAQITRAGPMLRRQLSLRIWDARPDVSAEQRRRRLKRRAQLSEITRNRPMPPT